MVINVLALSRIWYVAALIHVPQWVVWEINSFIFPFFSKDKRDLVKRSIAVQPTSSGGFSLTSIQFKFWALHVQWIRRFMLQVSRSYFFVFYCRDLFNMTPNHLLASPHHVDASLLPPFYKALLEA